MRSGSIVNDRATHMRIFIEGVLDPAVDVMVSDRRQYSADGDMSMRAPALNVEMVMLTNAPISTVPYTS